MTIEEAIRILEDGEWWAAIDDYCHQEREEFDLLYDAIDLTVAALRAQQEAEKTQLAQDKSTQNEPLTLDELWEMDGDKIYIKFIGACKRFYDDEYAPYYGRHEQYVQKYNGMLRACYLPLKYYGKAWLAYRHKPKEETKC